MPRRGQFSRAADTIHTAQGCMLLTASADAPWSVELRPRHVWQGHPVFHGRASAGLVERREAGPVAAALLLLAAVVLADVLTGDETVFVSLLVTAPLLAAAFTRPGVTAAVGFIAAVLAVLLVPAGAFGSTNHLVRIAAIVSASTLAVIIAARRERRDAALLQMTAIADVAQNAVLWPVPPTLRDLTLAARYVSASSSAKIGGDLYEVVETAQGVRVIVGDVRGKGLLAVRLASAVLGSFREVAHTRADLQGVRAALETTVRRIASEEDFVTAVLLEIDDTSACVLSCGHPPPIIVDRGQVHDLDAGQAGLPLGLGDDHEQPRTFHFPPGARLLLHTDGLLETKDDKGRFFPALEQVDELCAATPRACLDGLLQRLREHAGGHIDDDVALLLIERTGR